MKKQRPVFLNLMQIRLPVPALVSILHRISGVILFLLIPLMLWMLQQSLVSFAGFTELQEALSSNLARFVLWVLLASLLYHLIAGIRHLCMDMGWGESLIAGRRSAKIVLVLSIILIIGVGVCLW